MEFEQTHKTKIKQLDEELTNQELFLVIVFLGFHPLGCEDPALFEPPAVVQHGHQAAQIQVVFVIVFVIVIVSVCHCVFSCPLTAL